MDMGELRSARAYVCVCVRAQVKVREVRERLQNVRTKEMNQDLGR